MSEHESAASRLRSWAGEWVETLRVAPPFSSRRRELLAILADDNPDQFVLAAQPGHPDGCQCRGVVGWGCAARQGAPSDDIEEFIAERLGDPEFAAAFAEAMAANPSPGWHLCPEWRGVRRNGECGYTHSTPRPLLVIDPADPTRIVP